MKVQSLSIVVPGGCPNACRFCVARMYASTYTNQIEKNLRFQDLYIRDFTERLAFARDNGCNTVILTGDGEPVINTSFLTMFANCNASLASPFRWIELQTSGVTLNEEKLRWLRNSIRVSTISLSISALTSGENADINQTPPKLDVDLPELTELIKVYDFNLRISVNMTRSIGDWSPFALFTRLHKDLHADQVTLRRLFADPDGGPEADWVKANSIDPAAENALRDYIRDKGRHLDILPYGADRYDVHGMSVVLDVNCMPQVASEDLRYLILQPNCKLYTRWDTKGSLLF